MLLGEMSKKFLQLILKFWLSVVGRSIWITNGRVIIISRRSSCIIVKAVVSCIVVEWYR